MATTVSVRPRQDDSTYWLTIIASSGLAAVVSVAIQGFFFGNNNLFHVPLILGWHRDPSLSDDPFFATLDGFASGAWFAIKILATEENVRSLFLVLHTLVRWAFLVAVAFAAGSFGINEARSQIFLIIVFSLTPVLRGVTDVGHGEMLAETFSHTELTHPLVLWSLGLLARGRIVAAFALNGLVFDVNAFVAVWNGVALLGGAAGLMADLDRRDVIKKTALGLALGGLIALPVMVWILSILGQTHAAPPIDYPAFLKNYYPQHFFISAGAPEKILIFASVTLAGILALRNLGNRPWFGIFLGFCTIFAIGIIVPEVTSSPVILNLHLLRVDCEIQILAVMAISVLAIKSIKDRAISATGAFFILAMPVQGALLIAVSLFLKSRAAWALMAAGALVIFCSLNFGWPRQIAIAMAIVLVATAVLLRRERLNLPLWGVTCAAIASLGFSALLTRIENAARAHDPRVSALQEVAEWARDQTPPDSWFLIPPDDQRGAPIFQIVSRRKVWVDFKRGAAAMWHQPYHHQWSQRLSEVRALRTSDEKLSYALQNGIAYILLEGAGTGVFSNAYYHVVAVTNLPH